MGGISGILKNIFLIVENIIRRYSEKIEPHVKHSKYIILVWRLFNLLFNLFMLAWTIAGGYWVYHIYAVVTISEYSECSELLYKFGFGIVTSSYILLLLTCVCVCCCAGICLKMNKRRQRGRSLDSGSELGSMGESDSNNDSLSIGADEEERRSRSNEDSVSVEGGFMTNTLTSTVENSIEHSGEEFLRRFRHLDSPVAFNEAPPGREATTAILRYDSSPYPSRHGNIRRVQHSPPNYPTHSNQNTPTPNSTSPHNHQTSSRQLGSDSSDPIPLMNRDIPMVDNPQEGVYQGNNGLYITINSEGFSVTEV